jgi:hypothetical protein
VFTGRVYISRDVVFDEAIFPFKHMHPNAGALLRREILLLDPSLHNSEFGHEPMDDFNMENTRTTNTVASPVLAVL